LAQIPFVLTLFRKNNTGRLELDRFGELAREMDPRLLVGLLLKLAALDEGNERGILR
jgi:hypothetical protein